MHRQRESHKQALRQLLNRHSIESLRQDQGQIINREQLIDEILKAVPFPSFPSLPLIFDEETRQAALKHTEDTLTKLVEICRSLDLPLTALPRVMELYASAACEVVAEKQRAEAAARADRLPTKMTSLDREWKPLRIKPGVVTPVTLRPQWRAYRVEEIEIDGDPSRWRVHDIKIGNVSQFTQFTNKSHPVPGERFRKGGIMSELRLNTCQTAMDFTLDVEYVGPLAEGEVFEATLVGVAAT